MYSSDNVCDISKGTFVVSHKYFTHTLESIVFMQP